jgi:hypothetical protein
VLPHDAEVTIEVASARDVSVNFDMQSLASLLPGDRIVVRRSAKTVRLLHPVGYNYYATLRRSCTGTNIRPKTTGCKPSLLRHVHRHPPRCCAACPSAISSSSMRSTWILQRLHRVHRRNRRGQVDPDRCAGAGAGRTRRRWRGARRRGARQHRGDLPYHPALDAWLAERELAGDDGTCCCAARSTPRPQQGLHQRRRRHAAQLREVGDQLVDIHGQHAHQLLLRPTPSAACSTPTPG